MSRVARNGTERLKSLDAALRFARAELGADITAQRLLILINVSMHEGLSQSELLSRLDSTSTTALSRNLAELSDWTPRKLPGLGLIELRADRLNLRRKQIHLTGKGRGFLRRWLEHVEAHALPTPVQAGRARYRAVR